MTQYSLQFEMPDLATWLWLGVGVMAVAETVRYLAYGRQPARPAGRASIAAGCWVIVGATLWAGLRPLDSFGHVTACVLLGAWGGVWLGRSYRRTTRPIAPGLRYGLLALRSVALAIVVLMVAGPVWQTSRTFREPALLAFLIDDSRSMTVRDVPVRSHHTEAEAIPRIEAVRQAFRAHRGEIDRLERELEVRWFVFSDAVSPGTPLSLRGDGPHTAVADAVLHVHHGMQQEPGRLAGIVLVSDGRDNFSTQGDPADAAAALAEADTALYAVGVGSDVPFGQTRTLLARRLNMPSRVSAHNRLGIQAEFLAAGLDGETIVAELLFDGEVVERVVSEPAGVREVLRLDLSHVPTVGGLHQVTVRGQVEGEPETRAELSQFVRVIDDKIQVLYVDRARYERAAVGRALDAAVELRVTRLDLDRPPGQVALPLLRETEAQWNQFHVVVLGDIDIRVMPQSAMREIRRLVEQQGRGFAMLGGIRTLGSGAYRASVLDRLMPVDLGAAGHWPGPLEVELTEAGRVHPICMIADDPATNAERWRELPPLTGAGRLHGLSPAAEVLLATPGDGHPLLVVHEAGAGRVAAVAFDSTWQWAFADDDATVAQKRFWRQLVLWLADRRPDVWVVSDRPRYDLALLRAGRTQVVLRAGAVDPTTGAMPEDLALAGTLVGPDGRERSLSWIRRDDELVCSLSLDEPGDYRVRVRAHSGDEEIGASEAGFVVEAFDVELADPIADLDTLKHMAELTAGSGGRYAPLDDLDALLRGIRAAGHVTETTRTVRHDLVRDHPWSWLAAFVLLLGAEWFIRRLKGLV